MPSLSICIPTYNRSKCLAELLQSIVEQNTSEIEVIVSDDASSDDTASVAEAFKSKLPRYRFIRQSENIGLDRNFLAVMAAATKDYIWLIGDDDRLEPNGIQRVLAALERWPGVSGLTLGAVDYDTEMKRPTGLRATPTTQLIHGLGETFVLLADLLGFMSVLVVDRKRWREVVDRERDLKSFENYYVHLFMIARILEQAGGTWGVVQEPCVGFRTSNDQFLTKFGWRKRLEIDIRAYDQLADSFFADAPQIRAEWRKRIFNTHIVARLINAKTTPGQTLPAVDTLLLLARHYADIGAFWTKATPLMIAPKWLLRSMRTGYKRFVKSSGAARARVIAQAPSS